MKYNSCSHEDGCTFCLADLLDRILDNGSKDWEV